MVNLAKNNLIWHVLHQIKINILSSVNFMIMRVDLDSLKSYLGQSELILEMQKMGFEIKLRIYQNGRKIVKYHFLIQKK